MAGLVALFAAWLWDRLLYRSGLPEKLRVGIGVPIGEELLKLGAASYFGIPLILIHPIFGFGEGLFESIRLYKVLHWQTVLVGVFTHLLFGIAYVSVKSTTVSLFSAIILHSLWNQGILAYQKRCK